MPKLVDHDVRRSRIAEAVWRIATSRGLQGVTFREVAVEAEVSVSLVQHYFGTKEGLLIWSLNHNTAHMSARIARRVRRAGAAATPRQVLTIVLSSFLPTDAESRMHMLVYHAFSAAALTDPALRADGAFDNAAVLTRHLADQLHVAAPRRENRSVDQDRDAQALLALVLGLSLSVLLAQNSAQEATAILDRHLDRLVQS